MQATTGTGAAPRTVGVGFIGVGGRGHALLRSILTVPGVEVRAVCDVAAANRAKARETIAAAGGAKLLETVEWSEVLAAPGVEAVVSALPCDLHKQCYLDTIAAGKDLYGEKPMCLTAVDCEAIVSAAAASNTIVQIGFQRRADPRFLETMQLVHAGELGDLVEAR